MENSDIMINDPEDKNYESFNKEETLEAQIHAKLKTMRSKGPPFPNFATIFTLMNSL